MWNLLKQSLSTPRTVVPPADLTYCKNTLHIGTPLHPDTIKLFRGSLAIREVDAGSNNAEEEELKAVGNAYYDSERFGIHFVASPRHADMLLVTGPVTLHMKDALRRTFEATPDPKIVVAVGDAAIDGGVYKGSPAIIGGVDKVIPVNFFIPGDPPSPKIVLGALLQIFNLLNSGKKAQYSVSV